MKRRLVYTAFSSVVCCVAMLSASPSLEAASSVPYGPPAVAFRYSPQVLQFGPDDRGVVHTGFASVGWRWMTANSTPARGQRSLGSDLLKVNLASLSLVLPLHGAGWFPTFGGSLRRQSARIAYPGAYAGLYPIADERVVTYRRDFAIPRGQRVRTALAAEHHVELALREPNWKR